MDGKKFEKLAEKISKKDKNNAWKDEIGFVGTEAVFYTNRVTLISNYYKESEVDVRRPLTLEPVEDPERAKAKHWRTILKRLREQAPDVTIEIPALFYKIAKAFKNPLLVKSRRAKTGAVYEVTFFDDKITVGTKEEKLLTYAEDYHVKGKIKEPMKYNLFYLMRYQPKYAEFLPLLSGTAIRVVTSHDKDIKDFEACFIMNMRDN